MLCRLCLLDCDDLLEVFDNVGERLKIRAIVAQHFGFQLSINDQISDKICSRCWLEIENFHAFFVDVRRAQNRLNIELAKNIDPDPDTDEADYEDGNEDDIDDDDDDDKNTSDDLEDEYNDIDERSDGFMYQYLSAINADTSNITGDIDIFAAPSRTGSKVLSGGSLNYKGYTNYISKNNNIIVVDIGSSKHRNNSDDDIWNFCPTKNENNNSIQDENEFIRSRFKSLGIPGLNDIIDRNELSITAFPKTEKDIINENEKELSKYIQLNCELCGDKFSIFSNLKYHFRYTHNIAGYVVCCNEKLYNPDQLVSHVMKHLDRSRFTVHPRSNQFSCYQRQFEDIKNTKEYLRGKSSRAQCQQCGLWCKSRYILQKHIRTHVTDSNDLLCTICGKKFLSDIALQRHLTNVHYKERKYQCTMCDKAFKWSINLKEHMAIHTGNRLYSCRYCSKTFNASSNLHSHRKKAHRDEWEEERKQRSDVLVND